MQQVDPALTIVPADHIRKPEDEESEESSSEEEEVDLPPGPISSEHCTVGGPGFVGGAAKANISFYVTAKDETDKRIREGGAYVTATVNPGNSARAGGAELVFADMRDNGDGTYTATYAVEARGDYELSVEVNGSPIGGSPFPVFFSPPEPAAAEPPASSSAPNGTPPAPAGPAVASMPGGMPAVPSVTAADGTVLSTANAALSLQPPSVLGPQAHRAGVAFPKDQGALDRTLLVGNLNPSVTDEQIRQLFGFCGSVIGVDRVGDQKQFVLVEYTYASEAAAASAMNGMQVVDRKIQVEQAAVADRAKEVGDVNPYAAIQAHQLQHVMAAQIQSSSLAAQVAAMRVQAKTNPASATLPGLAQNSASQKNAALAAIAALSRRLGGSAPAQMPRPESPTKVKRRREVSPTIRKRGDRGGRSRSPSARPPPRRFERQLSPPIKRRDSSRERRSSRQDSSRDRRRGRSDSQERGRREAAIRRRGASRERSSRHAARDEPSRRDRHGSRDGEADRRREQDRVSSRHRDAQRDQDTTPRMWRDDREDDRKHGSERRRERDTDERQSERDGGDGERRHDRERDRKGRRASPDDADKGDSRANGKAEASKQHDDDSSPKANGRASEKSPGAAEGAGDREAQKQKQAEEAQLLRERALEALNASAAKPADAETEDNIGGQSAQAESLEGTEGRKRARSTSRSPEPEQEERKKKKEKKDKKHKKHKRHHRDADDRGAEA